MKFYAPIYLYLLFLLPLILFWTLKSYQKNNQRKSAYIKESAREKMALSKNMRQDFIKISIGFLLLSLTIIALARPLGEPEKGNTYLNSRDIVFMIDISDSMRARDIKTKPDFSRLDAVKHSIAKIVEKLENERFGLILFAGQAMPILPLTSDHDLFLTFLDSIDFSFSNEGSTNIRHALEIARKRFGKTELNDEQIILLFSDGEDQYDANIISSNTKAKSATVVYTVGVGSEAGAPIPMGNNLIGKAHYKTYQGKTIKTRLEKKILAEIAAAAGGKYLNLSEKNFDNEILKLIMKHNSHQIQQQDNIKYKEFFPLLLIFIILLLFIEIALPRERNINCKE